MLVYTHSSDCINMKARRQALILDLLGREPVRNQEQLRRGLQGGRCRGDAGDAFPRYQGAGTGEARRRRRLPAPDAANDAGRRNASALSRAVTEFVTGVDRVQHMIVLRTGPGQAHAAAIAIDRAQLPEVVGTIAGDDTILVIARDVRGSRTLADRLAGLIQL